jgi:hypothetical protein
MTNAEPEPLESAETFAVVPCVESPSMARRRGLAPPLRGHGRGRGLLPGVRRARVRLGLTRQRPERPRRLRVAITYEGNETRSNHRRLRDRGLSFLQVAQKPASCDPRMSVRLLPCNQEREFERLGEADLPDLSSRRLRNEQVLVLQRSPEDGSWMPLRGRSSSSPGPDGGQSLERRKRNYSPSMRKGLCRHAVLALVAAVVAVVAAALALAGSSALILPTHTPGVRYSKVTQATISNTICVRGWTAAIRPPASYTRMRSRRRS